MKFGNKNYQITGLLFIATLFAAWWEGYFPMISLLLWIVLILGFLIILWLSGFVSTKRFLSLIFAIFVLEYIKESIGISSDLWRYNGTSGFYLFGVWLWVIGGLITYTISTRIIIKIVRKFRIINSSMINVVIFMMIVAVIPVTLGDYWQGLEIRFYVFYAILISIGFFASRGLDTDAFLTIVLSAWLVGNPSEYVGSINSGIWTYIHNSNYPPLFLVIGCWPLEILVQFSISAFLSGEPLSRNNG